MRGPTWVGGLRGGLMGGSSTHNIGALDWCSVGAPKVLMRWKGVWDVLCRRTQSSGGPRPRRRYSGVQRSLASRIPDGVTIRLGRIGFTTLPRQPDTYTQLDCRFEESVGGARVDRSGPCAFLSAVSCLRGSFRLSLQIITSINSKDALQLHRRLHAPGPENGQQAETRNKL